MRSTLARWAVAIAVPIGLAVGIAIANDLASYDVPALLRISCALGVGGAVTSVVADVLRPLGAVTHRCAVPGAVPGCGFRVRLTGVDATENRTWQETAATHPHHTKPKRG